MGEQLPKDWKWVKLGEVCNTTSGGTPSRREPKFYNGNIPWVKSGELDKGVITDTEEKISDAAIKNSSAKVFPKGTLLIALYGATIGKLAFLGVDAATNQAICGIYKNEKIDSQYLYNYLFYKKQKLVNQGIGGAQPNISQNILKNLDIPLPPKPTQLAIVSKIEELFSELEKGIESLFTAKQQLKTYRQSVLKWAFEGKLTNGRSLHSFDLPDEYDISIAAEPEVEYKTVKNQGNQKNQINHSSDKGELPKGWKWVQIKEVSETYGGFAFKSGEFKSEGKYQVLRMGNVRPGVLRYDESPVFLDDVNQSILSRAQLQINDVIITQTGTRKKRDYGFTVLIPKTNLLLNQRIAAIRFHEKYLPKFFLYYSWTDLFKDQFFANETGNVGQGNVGMKAVTETLIPFCSIEEQSSIVQEIESRLSVADKMEESITQSLQQAEALKQSILKKAFEGKLI